MMGEKRAEWGEMWSFNFRNDPRRLPFVLSRYKFAAKMAGKNRSIIELGCGEGIGAPILAEHAKSYTGVDYDTHQIETAKRVLEGGKYTFVAGDFFDCQLDRCQTVVSLDVIEHIYREHEDAYVQAICSHLTEDGITVVGTPNETTAPYASELSRLAHVNMYSQERLKVLFEKYFANVFCFGMNDEIVHTGFAPMAQYIFVLACNKRK
ncbi:MAG: class I SAM-dependent methyltransferase [Chlamydiales bacterium]